MPDVLITPASSLIEFKSGSTDILISTINLNNNRLSISSSNTLFTGSVIITGPVTASAYSGSLTGSVLGTSSFANTSSISITSSASITSSFANTSSVSTTASFANTASSLVITNNYRISNLTASTISASVITASAFFGTSSWATNAITSSYLVPTNIYSGSIFNANSIVINSTASLDKHAVTREYVQSRGTNLITNGYGDLLNIYNFPGTVFDTVDLYGGGGSFSAIAPGSNITLVSTEYISVDANRTYIGTVFAKAGNLNGTMFTASAQFFAGFDCYDIDRLSISPQYVKKVNTAQDTYLAQDLNPGDTFMLVSGSASGWYTGSGNAYERQLVWWPYTSSLGYVFTPFTYTRKISNLSNSITGMSSTSASFYSTNGLWNSSAITSSTSASRINLTSSWGGPLIPSGSPVRNASSGGTYKYGFASSVALASGSWTRFTSRIEGTETGSLDAAVRQFRPETKFIRLIYLLNYNPTAVPLSSSIHRISSISFAPDPDYSGSAFVQNGNVFGAAATLGTIDSQVLTFKTSNTERVRINTSGNVGIGTTSISNKLVVIGAASIGSTTYNTTGPTNGLIVEGNVGIGRTNPVNKLDVVGNISASSITASLFFGTSSWSINSLTASSLVRTNNYFINSLSASGNVTASSLYTVNGITSSVGGILFTNLAAEKFITVNTAGQDAWLFHSSSTGDNLIITSSGQIRLGNYTNATTTTNGALAVNGGISVGNDIFSGGKISSQTMSASVHLVASRVGVGSTNPQVLLDVNTTSSTDPVARFMGLVGIGGTPSTTNMGQLYILGAGSGSNVYPFKFDSVAMDTTATSAGKALKGWLKAYINNVSGFTDGTTYYIPVYE